MTDIAHPAGLVATGLYPSPVPYSEFVTTTTHKTLRGPRGGMILAGKNIDNPFGIRWKKSGNLKKIGTLLNGAVFPGIQVDLREILPFPSLGYLSSLVHYIQREPPPDNPAPQPRR